MDPFSLILHFFERFFKASLEKNLAIGPLPITSFLSFSKVIYAKPFAPSEIAQLFKLSKKLLGFELVSFAGIALTTPLF